MTDEERIAYLERQSAARLALIEDLDSTKRYLERECSRLCAIAEAARAYRRAMAAWQRGGDNRGWQDAQAALFAALDAQEAGS